ncbi:MAG: biotin/lipoyl-containing protein, partial [Alphaproteobacteria bacterium]
MSIEIKVPPLGESVAEGTIARWMKSVGDAVAQDEPIAELETDKVTLEVPAPAAGVLSSIVAEAGATVSIDAVIALLEEGAAADAPKASPAAPAPTAPPAAPQATASAAAPAPTPAPAPSASAPSSDHPLSPAVKRLVEENNLDPQQIPATGKDGRLTKGDVLAAIETGSAKAAAPTTPSPVSSAPVPSQPPAATPRADNPREERVPMTRLRKVIAQRLKDAQNTAAMLTTFNEVDMSKVMALRSEYR